MVGERVLGLLLLNVPQNTRRVTTGRDDFAFVDEATARQVTLVLSELTVRPLDESDEISGRRLGAVESYLLAFSFVAQFVDRAQVVETTARDKRALR